MLTAMAFQFLALLTSRVADAAAAVFIGIAVEQLAPVAGLGHPHAVVLARYGREVEDNHDHVARRLVGHAQEADRAGVAIIGVDPLETALVEVVLVQGGLGAVGA